MANLIKANELRLGNWVKHSNAGDYRQLVPIEFSAILSHNLVQYYEPIPLTPEVLEKAGFKIDKDGFAINEDLRFYFELNKPVFYMQMGFTDNNTGKHSHWVQIASFKYLHQLQNLYYTLTGEELNIEL